MSWIQNAKVGDKVVFIDTGLVTLCGYRAGLTDPKLGDICTITGFHDYRGNVCLFLKEHGDEQAFFWDAFRPVEPRQTDISIFQRMLNTAPAKVGEVA